MAKSRKAQIVRRFPLRLQNIAQCVFRPPFVPHAHIVRFQKTKYGFSFDVIDDERMLYNNLSTVCVGGRILFDGTVVMPAGFDEQLEWEVFSKLVPFIVLTLTNDNPAMLAEISTPYGKFRPMADGIPVNIYRAVAEFKLNFPEQKHAI